LRFIAIIGYTNSKSFGNCWSYGERMQSRFQAYSQLEEGTHANLLQ